MSFSGRDSSMLTKVCEEFIFVLSGRVEWQAGSEKVILDPGDSVYFDSRLPHRGRALDGEASAVVVTYSPEQER